MKKNRLLYLLLFGLFLPGCNSNSVNENPKNSPLKATYEYFDEINESDFNFAELQSKLDAARGKNDVEAANAVVKEFKAAHENCLKKLEERYPAGTVQIPFEQIGGKDTVTVKNIYLSGFWFPWNTAFNFSLKFTVEYEVIKKDVWFAKVPLTFYDNEDDILCIINAPCNKEGKTEISVRTNTSFKKLSKVIIH